MTMQAIPTTSRGGGAGVEQLGEGKPGNADRYRADRDPEGELERAVGEVAPAEGRQRAEQEVVHVSPKIADHRGELHRG